MKHQAEEELLKTLNGQLNELPGVAKTMVQQYQMSAIVLSILNAVLFIAALAATIWLSVFFYKKYHSDDDDYYYYSLGLTFSALLGGILSLGLLCTLSINIIHACAPIASIVSSLIGTN